MPCLLANGYILTMDAARRTFASGFVLTDSEGRVASVGPMTDCPEAPGAERIDCTGCIVVPGLIDALHVHWSHLFPGMRQPPSAADFMDEPAHLLAARLAASALAAGGVTATMVEMPAGLGVPVVNDVLAAFRRQGVAALGAVPAELAPLVDGAAVILTADVIALDEGRASEASMRAAAATARQLGRRLLLRIAPEGSSAEALRAAQMRLGRSSVYHLMEMGLLDDTCLLVCPEHLDDLDRALILESGCHVIGLPLADAVRGAGSTAFSALARAGVPCALGTEGPGAGWSTDMVEQMKAAVMAQNTLMLDPAAMSTERALEMATINAAEALGISDTTGSIEPGKRADIAVFDTRQPHQQISAKPLSAFVACARATEAVVVLAHGDRVNPGENTDIADAIVARRGALSLMTGRRNTV